MSINFSAKFLPYEKQILTAVANALPLAENQQFVDQIECVNKVQRLLEWNEVEFYCMHWFKVRWPERVLFARRDEFQIASVECAFGESVVPVKILVTAGHVFSLEAKQGLKALARDGVCTIKAVQLVAL